MSEAKSLIIESLVLLADRFCEATGQTRSSVAKAIHGRGGQIDDLASGKRDLTTRSAEDALQWFADRWPDDLDWPDDIARPSRSDAAAPGVAAGPASPKIPQAGTGHPLPHEVAS